MTAGETAGRDPLVLLEEIRKREQSATKGPWRAERKHGTDFSDEAWSLESIVDADGEEIAITYWTGPLEPANDMDAEFLLAARSDIPRLLAGYDALLNLAASLEQKSARLQAGAAGDDGYGPSSVLPDRARTGRAYAYREAADGIRAAIGAAVTGEEAASS